jgi:hypothetical protein
MIIDTFVPTDIQSTQRWCDICRANKLGDIISCIEPANKRFDTIWICGTCIEIMHMELTKAQKKYNYDNSRNTSTSA